MIFTLCLRASDMPARPSRLIIWPETVGIIHTEAQYEKTYDVGHAFADRLFFRFCRKY